MPVGMTRCRITVLKRILNQDLVDQHLDIGDKFDACDQLQDGRELVLEQPFDFPEGFCRWAWADIRGDIMTIAAGGDLVWMKQRGATITGFTDWFRPVIFKIERVG